MSQPAWMEHAACRGEDPLLFFGPEFETPAAPVRRDCEQWAFSFQAQAGIAGGHTEQERAQRRRRARRGAA
jgi:WhiB family transcriptional regulator, redox-sensing transcriptional regulator